MGTLSLLFTALELFQALHDGTIWKALFMLNSGYPTLELVIDLIPGTWPTFILGRCHSQLESAPIVRVVIRRGAGLMMLV